MEFEPEEMDREYTPELQNNGSDIYSFGTTVCWYSTAFGAWIVTRYSVASFDIIKEMHHEVLVNLN